MKDINIILVKWKGGKILKFLKETSWKYLSIKVNRLYGIKCVQMSTSLIVFLLVRCESFDRGFLLNNP